MCVRSCGLMQHTATRQQDTSNSTAQRSIAQHSAAQRSTAQHSAAQRSASHASTAHGSTQWIQHTSPHSPLHTLVLTLLLIPMNFADGSNPLNRDVTNDACNEGSLSHGTVQTSNEEGFEGFEGYEGCK